MQFNINPEFDVAGCTSEYAQQNKARLKDFLPEDQAIKLTEAVHNKGNYEQAFFLDNEYRQSTYEQLQALSAEERQELMKQVYEQGARGVGFWYGREAISDASDELIQAYLSWVNSDSVIETIKQITGIDTIKSASAQVTRFLPGDFLTRHQDDVGTEKRRVAYSICLSPAWHPDWGGLLQFYEKDGTPTDTWAPEFNSISLFDVTNVHAVTSMAAFAPSPRYAISGWFKEVG